jgi:hypothetical protein
VTVTAHLVVIQRPTGTPLLRPVSDEVLLGDRTIALRQTRACSHTQRCSGNIRSALAGDQ